MKIISGDLKPLKGQTSFDIMFRYDSMLIGADNVSEKEYLTKKRQDWNEKEEGKGFNFVEMWFDDRERLYEPAFVEAFEKQTKFKLYDEAAKYTLILKTKRTEGGWNLGVLSHPGEIDGELWIVETADRTNVIAKIGFYKFTSRKDEGGSDFEVTERIQPAYLLAGKGLGDFIKRKAR